ncbi:MAG TPA: hypothetical protein VMH28_20610 [Candidatus Acidoferrales bacterium]|nr:hypothetical protein [Candidatus Acidoferrales bacterium]
MSPDSLSLEIGGKAIRLVTTDPDFRAALLARYRAFERPSARPALELSIRLRDYPASRPDEDVRVTSQDGRWVITRGDFRSVWYPESGQGTVEQTANLYAIDTVLRIIHTLFLVREGGFLLHASSAVRNHRAFVFSGLSGAGKTTISRLAPPDVHLLTDEISYIRRDTRGYAACGTPFFGELGVAGENVSAPVAALYFLAKGAENRIDPIPPAEAARLLLRNILFFAGEAELVHSLFQAACDFLQAVPARRLSFLPDERVWELIR